MATEDSEDESGYGQSSLTSGIEREDNEGRDVDVSATINTAEELIGGIDVAAGKTLSDNMRSFFTLQDEGDQTAPETVTVTSETASLKSDNRIPSDLLPYKKDKITLPFCRTVYCYRHLLSNNDSVGRVWETMGDLTDYQTELAIMYQQIIIEGRQLYESRILCIAPTLGILRSDKQACLSWREVMTWALRADNHLNKEIQYETIRKLVDLFHCKLDGPGNDFWLTEAVDKWERKRGIMVCGDRNFEGNRLLKRQRSGTGFVQALFKKANLDTHVQSLRFNLKKRYRLGLSKGKKCRGATQYLPVLVNGSREG
jgi:hypothetical protein